MTTERTPGALGSNDGLGVAVLVDGAVVAWFAELDEYATKDGRRAVRLNRQFGCIRSAGFKD